ncbi:MAG: bifunctional 4-hydroxy-2-oxoglutarate aldolase/2-dehydro-3-deoxy-phosphogluconate aldolase [Acidobacteria bacterium]|nr:bifunctional 4-hydroxy-2-oxoglutarate aldolase/2-dehydro-3-deoxy-phosphogluconate aldolase [Acidobacteriota bacterium]
MSDILTRIRRTRLVPIITIDDPSKAVPLVDALASGGLPCAEVTFRTASAAESLRRITGERPDLLVGAGTVLSPEQAALAQSCGARFVLSPGLNRRVVRWCQDHGLPIFPGVCTPTDIEMALEQGLEVVKVFPIEPIGGLPYLKAIAAPFPTLEYLPTGGISAANLAAYLSFDKVVACGGSWMTPAAWIAAGAFDRVRDAARDAVAAARPAAAGR